MAAIRPSVRARFPPVTPRKLWRADGFWAHNAHKIKKNKTNGWSHSQKKENTNNAPKVKHKKKKNTKNPLLQMWSRPADPTCDQWIQSVIFGEQKSQQPRWGKWYYFRIIWEADSRALRRSEKVPKSAKKVDKKGLRVASRELVPWAKMATVLRHRVGIRGRDF